MTQTRHGPCESDGPAPPRPRDNNRRNRPTNNNDDDLRAGRQDEIAGFTVETTCCVNKKAYKHDVDIPCNAAARRGVAGAALVALLGLLLCN